jgi:hypothetical protein
LARTPPKAGAIRVRSTDDGLQLADSILWFDSELNGELSFMSSAVSATKTKVPQVIATEETVKILEAYRKRPNALICQYNRPFSIGRLKMELLPSGSVLGGASLYVETDKGRLLYAPQLQTQKIATVRQMQLKKASTLVLGAFHPDPNAAMPNRKKERERLIERVKKSVAERGEFPVILCNAVSTAQELTKLLTDENIPVAVHPTIFKINKIYEACGSSLGKYSVWSRRSHTRQRVLLMPRPSSAGAMRKPLPEGTLLVVEETMTDPTTPPPGRSFAERFHMGSTVDGVEMREIISAVGPKELYFFGPYAKRYVEEMKGSCPKIKPLFPFDQPALF